MNETTIVYNSQKLGYLVKCWNKPRSLEGVMWPFMQIKMTAVKLGRYKTQVKGHCFTNTETTLNVYKC